MKILLAFLFFLPGCSSKLVSKAEYISYEKAFALSIGKSSAEDIVRQFGEPSHKSQKSNYEVYNYNDPHTGNQRFSATFVGSEKKLSSFFWIPQEQESEFSLEGAKSRLNSFKFTENAEPQDNPHAIDYTKSLRDEKSGVIIRFVASRNVVEAIGKYDVNLRLPATHDNTLKKKVYKFGDEQ